MTPAAFDALVAAHTERLCRFVYRFVGDRETAEDVVQEVFLAIWERKHEWKHEDPLPYLYRAAHNKAISQARHAEVHVRFEARVLADEGVSEAADAELRHSELSKALADAIERLPEKCRLVFRMSREQGLTHAQIAEALDLSTKTVESHIWRALTSLRASLAPFLGVVLLISR